MLVSEFDYELPEELIAQRPAPERTASRLLHLDARSGEIEDLAFADLPARVGEGDAVVLNDTRVIKARLPGRKRTGGRIEVFIERALGANDALALVRASHAPPEGSELLVGDGVRVIVSGREADLYRLHFLEPVDAVLERFGAVPLPPYITHAPQTEDAERYQTVYAAVPGAVAAPTAGLHFDAAMLERLGARGARLAKVTLHVGVGTFQPVRSERVEDHRMHLERYTIPRETMDALRGRRVLAVGNLPYSVGKPILAALDRNLCRCGGRLAGRQRRRAKAEKDCSGHAAAAAGGKSGYPGDDLEIKGQAASAGDRLRGRDGKPDRQRQGKTRAQGLRLDRRQ